MIFRTIIVYKIVNKTIIYFITENSKNNSENRVNRFVNGLFIRDLIGAVISPNEIPIVVRAEY